MLRLIPRGAIREEVLKGVHSKIGLPNCLPDPPWTIQKERRKGQDNTGKKEVHIPYTLLRRMVDR